MATSPRSDRYPPVEDRVVLAELFGVPIDDLTPSRHPDGG